MLAGCEAGRWVVTAQDEAAPFVGISLLPSGTRSSRWRNLNRDVLDSLEDDEWALLPNRLAKKVRAGRGLEHRRRYFRLKMRQDCAIAALPGCFGEIENEEATSVSPRSILIPQTVDRRRVV